MPVSKNRRKPPSKNVAESIRQRKARQRASGKTKPAGVCVPLGLRLAPAMFAFPHPLSVRRVV